MPYQPAGSLIARVSLWLSTGRLGCPNADRGASPTLGDRVKQSVCRRLCRSLPSRTVSYSEGDDPVGSLSGIEIRIPLSSSTIEWCHSALWAIHPNDLRTLSRQYASRLSGPEVRWRGTDRCRRQSLDNRRGPSPRSRGDYVLIL